MSVEPPDSPKRIEPRLRDSVSVPPPLPPKPGAPVPKEPDSLDLIILNCGLAPRGSGVGKNFEGEIEGRKFSLHCSARTRRKYSGDGESSRLQYTGHRLEISAETSVKSRLAISFPRSALERWAARTNRWFQCVQVDGPTNETEPLTIWAVEPDWAVGFLKRLEVMDAIAKLMPVATLPPNIGLKLWPGTWTFSQRLPVNQITEEKMGEWLQGMTVLASAAEVEPPRNQVELTKFERMSKENPRGFGIMFGCGLIGIPMLLLGLFGLALGVVLLLLTR